MNVVSPPLTAAAPGGTTIPPQSLSSLFARFLRFGALAWGGPVAQIAMLRHSLVDEERWVTSEHFNRALALYQVLPGPEAHELCVYFGMLARGRVGGILAGLGFMLPGFLLMFALSWAYFEFGLDLHGEFAPLFAAIQAAVIALIVRAVHRIGTHILLNRWLWLIGVLAFAGQLAGVHFGVLLGAAGVAYALICRNPIAGGVFIGLCAIAIVAWMFGYSAPDVSRTDSLLMEGTLRSVSLATLFWSGLKTGLLTFGGAYTAIPLLQRDAVQSGGWMSNAGFMDGIALSGLLPAPLIIFATFVGYAGGGPIGALVVTLAVFLPAFAFSLLAHDPLERLIREPRVRAFLDGLTAAVVGLIAATALSLLLASIESILGGAIFVAATAALFYWNTRWLIPLVILAAAISGGIAMIFA
jgi:chromate transporter